MGFFGHAYATASYVVKHPTFGWLAFGANLRVADGRVHVEPRDSGRSRLFIAPAKLWITLAAGKIVAADYAPAAGTVTLRLAPADAHTNVAWLSLEGPDNGWTSSAGVAERGMIRITLGPQETLVKISESR
jgi:hypothetical protein